MLAKEFEAKVNCLRENTEKCKNFFSYNDSTRFMASSLSNLVNSLAEGFHKVKRKHEHDHKKI